MKSDSIFFIYFLFSNEDRNYIMSIEISIGWRLRAPCQKTTRGATCFAPPLQGAGCMGHVPQGWGAKPHSLISPSDKFFIKNQSSEIFDELQKEMETWKKIKNREWESLLGSFFQRCKCDLTFPNRNYLFKSC